MYNNNMRTTRANRIVINCTRSLCRRCAKTVLQSFTYIIIIYACIIRTYYAARGETTSVQHAVV